MPANYKYNKLFSDLYKRLAFSNAEISRVTKVSRQNIYNHIGTKHLLNKSTYKKYIERIIDYIPLKVTALTEKVKDLSALSVELKVIKDNLERED